MSAARVEARASAATTRARAGERVARQSTLERLARCGGAQRDRDCPFALALERAASIITHRPSTRSHERELRRVARDPRQRRDRDRSSPGACPRRRRPAAGSASIQARAPAVQLTWLQAASSTITPACSPARCVGGRALGRAERRLRARADAREQFEVLLVEPPVGPSRYASIQPQQPSASRQATRRRRRSRPVASPRPSAASARDRRRSRAQASSRVCAAGEDVLRREIVARVLQLQYARTPGP